MQKDIQIGAISFNPAQAKKSKKDFVELHTSSGTFATEKEAAAAYDELVKRSKEAAGEKEPATPGE